MYRNFIQICKYSRNTVLPLRSKKPKADKPANQNFLDFKEFRVCGGAGGDGCCSFLSLWCNENAGPDGGDGGNGGHVLFQASTRVHDLVHIPTIARANNGKKGANKDCHGKNAEHLIIEVPVGTIIRNEHGIVVGDLDREGLLFVAAKGGAGGKGNHYFVSDTEQTPKICEYGAEGESFKYSVEMSSMAHVGLIGFPNAGKSTLLRAVSRARPKVAPYPFTTLKPHLGMVQFDDYKQIAIADLPGLIPDSHKNRGLGIKFLKHAERCMALLYVIDVSLPEPWKQLQTLQNELSQFSCSLMDRSHLVVANKIDLDETKENVEKLRESTNLPVLAISAKLGMNVTDLLKEIRKIYNKNLKSDEKR